MKWIIYLLVWLPGLVNAQNDLFTRENITSLSGHITGSNDKSFDLFYKQSDRIDEIMKQPGFANSIVDNIITKEEIDPLLWKNGDVSMPVSPEPDWDGMHTAIARKYAASYADRCILDAKLRWYESGKHWDEYCKNVVLKVERYGPYEKMFPNNTFSPEWKWNAAAWDIFLHSADRGILTTALSWSLHAIRLTAERNAEYIDTYANLLYRLGKVKDAIDWQSRAVQQAPANAEFRRNLEKMNEGRPTWPAGMY